MDIVNYLASNGPSSEKELLDAHSGLWTADTVQEELVRWREVVCVLFMYHKSAELKEDWILFQIFQDVEKWYPGVLDPRPTNGVSETQGTLRCGNERARQLTWLQDVFKRRNSNAWPGIADFRK